LQNTEFSYQALLAASPPADFSLKDKQGYTPIHYACGEGYLEIVQVVDAARRTTHCAATGQPLSCARNLQVLHSSGATFDVTNVEGLTPLMCCSQQGHAHVARYIVDSDPRCVYFCNTAGDTALHYAGEVSLPSATIRCAHPAASTDRLCSNVPTGISEAGVPARAPLKRACWSLTATAWPELFTLSG
jgi:hypothetical protein